MSISCEFLKEGKCLLGYHDSSPNEGNCNACIAAGENNKEFADKLFKAREAAFSNPSTFAKKVISLSTDVVSWARQGMPVTNANSFSNRLKICKSCEFWNPKGFHGTGSCVKCGCSTQTKLRMATSKCPIDKWGPMT